MCHAIVAIRKKVRLHLLLICIFTIRCSAHQLCFPHLSEIKSFYILAFLFCFYLNNFWPTHKSCVVMCLVSQNLKCPSLQNTAPQRRLSQPNIRKPEHITSREYSVIGQKSVGRFPDSFVLPRGCNRDRCDFSGHVFQRCLSDSRATLWDGR